MGNRYFRIVSPGLPSWPPLLLDRKQNTARVVARYPIWRSFEKANWASTFVALLVVASIAFIAGPVIFTLVAWPLTLLVGIIVLPIAFDLIRRGTQEFMARQLFSTKTTVIATPTKILIKSRYLRRPVLIHRQWKKLPVRCRFILNQDHEASNRLSETQYGSRGRGYFQHAMLLEVVTSIDGRNPQLGSAFQGLQRATPIAEVSREMARNFVIVLTAAVELTSSQRQKT